MGGTGLIEAGTFLAILGGQLLAGMVPPWEAALIAMGFAAARLPRQPGRAHRAAGRGRACTIDCKSVARHLETCSGPPATAAASGCAILGISWFFAVGAVLLSEFAPLVERRARRRGRRW